MIYASPPLAFYMGGETYNDAITMATVVFGAGTVDDGNWPGDGGDSDNDTDSTETVPTTHLFIAEADKPSGRGDYPCRCCSATGYWGAAHAMTQVSGRWYLTRFAPTGRPT